MKQTIVRGLFLLAVLVICVLIGPEPMVRAAVIVEPLPASANLPENIPGPAASPMLTGNNILVTGGQYSSNGYSQHSYIFNTADQTWASYAPALQLAYHRQSMLEDGRVLVTGGDTFVDRVGYVYNSITRIYSPFTNGWTNAADLPKVMLGNAQSTLNDGRVMITGGADQIYSANSSTLYDNTYIYDPSANRWDEAAPLPRGVYGAAQSTLQDGRVLLTGGLSGYIYSFDSYIYDPAANTWTKAATLPYQWEDIYFRHAQVTLSNGKVLLMGNYNFYLYDPDTNTWTKDSANPKHLTNASMIQVGGNVYVMGGYDNLTYDNNSTVYKLAFDFTVPTAPVINGADGAWTGSDVNLTITPGTDADSGVDRTEYSLSGATTQDWTAYTNGETITVANSGQTTISARTVDRSGNMSTTAAAVVKIDRTLPTAPAINRSAASWSAADVTFTLTGGSDPGGSGVKRTEFSLSGAATAGWTAYMGTVTVSLEGQTTVHARTVDNVGNVSTESTAVISIDKTKPAAPAVTPASASWSKTDVSVSIVPGTDTGGSSVNRTEYKLSGATTSNWTAYTSPITISAEGQTTVEARTIDNAGNIGPSGSAAVRIDKTLPTAPSVTPATTDWTASSSVQVTVAGGTDSGSGVNRTEYSLSGAVNLGWTAYTGPFEVTAEGQTIVSARVIDQAGNISTTAAATVKIDRTVPAAPVISPAGGSWSSTNVNVTITAGADAVSGVHHVEYSLSGATTLGWTTYTGPVTITAEGATTVAARTVDHTGNISNLGTAIQRIDKSRPDVPVLTPSTAGWTSAASVAVTIAPGADTGGSGVNRVEYSLSGAATLGWTTYTGAVAVTAEGQTTVTARTVDNAGNVSNTATAAVQIDRTVPAVPTVNGASASWASTNVTLSLTAGTDAGGSGVNRTEYSLSGATTLGWTTYTGAVAITAEGVTTITARTIDQAGNLSTNASAQVSIDKTAPMAPVVTPGIAGWVSAAQVPVTVTPGTDSGGSGVLRVEYSLSGATTADWTVYTAPLAVSAQGETTVSARTVDQAGNKSQVQTEVVRIDRTAPSAPGVAPETEAWTAADSVTVTLTHGADTGGSGISRTEYSLSGASTLDWTDYTRVLTITAEGETVIHARTVDGAGNAGEASEAAVRIDRTAPDLPVVITPAAGTVTGNNKPTLAGTAERNAAVTLYVDGEALPAITADSGGQWTYTFPAALTDAEHKVKAVAADAAGNASGETAEVSFTVDTIAPGAPVITAPQLNAVLAEARPVISGEAEPYAAVTLLLDTLPIDGLTADADGGWTYTPAAPLSDGSHSVSAMAADAAGNASPASLTVSWKVDTQAPPAPVMLSPAGGTATSGNKPVISGTAETSAEVTVIIDGTEAGTVMAAGSGGGWSYTPADPLADGAHTIRAAAKDAAGNTSVESDTIHITVDTQAPGVPEVTFPASGTILNTGRPAIQGRSEAGASIRITLDGTEADTALSDGGGIWTYTPEAAWSEGPHTFKAQAVDAAGNAGPLSEGTFFTVDTIAPPVPVVHQPAEGAVINRPKPVITGTAEASVTVNVYVDGAAAGRVHAADNGGWTYTPSAELAVGSHTVQAQAADAAGNESAVSAERVFSVVSNNAELRTLELSGIILQETVTGTTYQYTAQVPYAVSSTSIAAAAADSNASVEILQNGRPAANPAALEVGAQTFTIQVTAQDGTTVQPYTVTVTRMPSDEAALSELTVDTAVLIPRFDPGTTDYTASVTHAVYAVTVHAKAASEVAALQMNGKLFAGNEGSLPVELDVGSNPVTVTVTAQDGVTVGTYRVDINREPSSNVMLSGLQLSEGSLEPAFESGMVHYETTVDYLTAGTTVTASVYDRNATLSVNGQALTSGEPSRLLPLEVGTNRLAVTVTAQDRVSRQSYIIEVHRKARPNVTLTSLELSGGTLLPAFDSGLTAYSVMVGNGVDRTTVTASVYDPGARIRMNGAELESGRASEPIALQVGDNAVELTVTAPDGLTQQTYSVAVHRASKSRSGRGTAGAPPAETTPAPPPVEEPVPPQQSEEPQAPEPPAGSSGGRCTQSAAASKPFGDMAGHWAELEVTRASGCGIVSGFEDGTFRPDEPVTRAQFVVMLHQAYPQEEGSQGAAAELKFADAASIPAWAVPAVGSAAASGVVDGYEDGTFRPNAPVTRAEMITMAAKTAGLPPASPDAVNALFSDAPAIPAWAGGYIAAAYQRGLVQGRGERLFAPLDLTTRAEAVALLLRIVQTK